MLVVGLTGSVAMGKSTVTAMFAEAGVPVFDADRTVHRLYRGAAAPLVENVFPGTSSEGAVDRDKLRQRVLGDPGAMTRLESLIHPLVAAERDAFVDQWNRAGALIVVCDIPLLFEVGAEKDMDIVLVVSTTPEIQMERLMQRDGMTAERAEAMRARQMPDAEKRQRAHFIVDTSASLEDTRRQVDDVLRAVSGVAAGGSERRL
ncbi:dephospho-CoA kinase [Bauldia sp.]|uniref:dephospho-CoA kinase n=1 Tax=Bauldia sp. TaxID=2575872 RepID=UPI003BAAB2E3